LCVRLPASSHVHRSTVFKTLKQCRASGSGRFTLRDMLTTRDVGTSMYSDLEICFASGASKVIEVYADKGWRRANVHTHRAQCFENMRASVERLQTSE